jgi:hypothetical protein
MGVLPDLSGGALWAFAASRSPLEFFTLLVGQRVVESSVGFGIDGFKLAGKIADDRGKLVDFGVCGIAASGVAQITTGLLDAFFEWLSGAVCFGKDYESLPALIFAELESTGEVMNPSFGKGFVSVAVWATMLTFEEEDEAE